MAYRAVLVQNAYGGPDEYALAASPAGGHVGARLLESLPLPECMCPKVTGPVNYCEWFTTGGFAI
ncbi:MAG: hypothetical protein NTY37_10280 [Methanothrix sp.]|nr:hypothetical protein [Methanothrix sp.]